MSSVGSREDVIAVGERQVSPRLDGVPPWQSSLSPNGSVQTTEPPVLLDVYVVSNGTAEPRDNGDLLEALEPWSAWPLP